MKLNIYKSLVFVAAVSIFINPFFASASLITKLNTPISNNLFGQVLGDSNMVAHNAGTNLIDGSGTIYTITQDGHRRAYSSAGAFLSYTFNVWANVVPINSLDMALPDGGLVAPRDGSIMCADRGQAKGTCYVVTQGKLAGFTNLNSFVRQGYNFNIAIVGDVSFLPITDPVDEYSNTHKPGAWINIDGTIYLVKADGLLGVTSANILESWGVNFMNVVTALPGDRNLQVVGLLGQKVSGWLNPLSAEPYYSGADFDKNYNYTPTPNTADFIIDNVHLSTTDVVANMPVVLTFSIKNIGSVSGVRPKYQFLHNPTALSAVISTVGCYSDTVLNPGSVCTDSWTLVFSQVGNEHINFTVNSPDENGAVKIESNYSNNKSTLDFIVRAAGVNDSFIEIKELYNKSGKVGELYQAYVGVKATLVDLSVNYISLYISGLLPEGVVAVSECTKESFRTTYNFECGLIIAGVPRQQGQFPVQIKAIAPTGQTGNANVNIVINSSTTTLPAFSITSPIGGEKISQGQPLTVSWNGGNDNTSVQFILVREWAPGQVPEIVYGDPFENKELKNASSSLGGSYTVTIPYSVVAGKYFIFGCLSNSLNLNDCTATYITKIPIEINGNTTASYYKDSKRLSDIRQLATALELYYNDANTYPTNLSLLVPIYLGQIPTPPSPPDGTCSSSQNNYTYTYINASNYNLNFCFGSTVGGYSAGIHVLSAYGIQ